MSLRVAVAVPFRQRGRDELAESEFVVVLSLDRGWFSPDQAEQLVEVAVADGLLVRDADVLRPTFEPAAVTVPTGFEPDETLLQTVPPFERILEAMVAAGFEKQSIVAEVNQLQGELAISLEAAAVLHARRNGVDVERAASEARAALRE